jgi:acetolactate synthase-1/2/3 large subunit
MFPSTFRRPGGPDALEAFDPAADIDTAAEWNAPNNAAETGALTGDALQAEVGAMLAEFCAAERPVVFVGAACACRTRMNVSSR